jgi:CHAT domain-containing protein
MDFYQAMAELNERDGRFQESEKALRSAIALSEQVLRSLRSETDRISWIRKSDRAYRMLVELRFRRQDIAGALELWEWYRAAPLRVETSAIDRPLLTDFKPAEFEAGPELPALNEVPRHESELTSQTVVSYAILAHGMAIWAYDERGIRGKWDSSSPQEIKRRIRRFSEYCANPRSDINLVRREGRKLYSLLLGGIDDWLPDGRAVVIEADTEIERAPLEALVDPNGKYLAESHSITWSPGVYYTDYLRVGNNLSADNHLLAIAPSLDIGGVEGREPLPDAISEAHNISRKFSSSEVLVGKNATLANLKRALPTAEMFHFAGHAIANQGRMGMLLAGNGSSDDSTALLDATTLGTLTLRSMRLAVLSACSTENAEHGNLLDADSLVRVFLRSGVPHVVASRWNVDSSTTASLLENFYVELLAGRSVGESLQLAAADIRAQPQTAHPYYWAAFNAFGRT